MSIKQKDVDLLYRRWTDGPKYTLVQNTSPIAFLERASAIGTPEELFVWLKTFPHRVGTFYVDAPDEWICKMKGLRPELDINQIPSE